MPNQWERWQIAVTGGKLNLGERGDPPSGYFRRSCGDGRFGLVPDDDDVFGSTSRYEQQRREAVMAGHFL